MKSADFLDLLQRRFGVDSDNKLAARLAWDRPRISLYRTGRREFSEETCAEVAELLELPPAYVMAEIAAERADCTRVREVWEALARMLRPAAALVLAGFLAAATPGSGAQAASAGADGNIPYAHMPRWLRRVLSRLLALLRRPGGACEHRRRRPARRLPPGCYVCLDCGAVLRKRPTVTRVRAADGFGWYGRRAMGKGAGLLAVVCLLGNVQGCATWQEMPATEKAWQALHLVDVAQTLNGPASDPCYFEQRSVRHLIGEKPEPAAVLAWGAAAAVLHFAADRWLERSALPDWSKTALRSIDLGYKGLTVAQNADRGVHPLGGNDCPWR